MKDQSEETVEKEIQDQVEIIQFLDKFSQLKDKVSQIQDEVLERYDKVEASNFEDFVEADYIQGYVSHLQGYVWQFQVEVSQLKDKVSHYKDKVRTLQGYIRTLQRYVTRIQSKVSETNGKRTLQALRVVSDPITGNKVIRRVAVPVSDYQYPSTSILTPLQ